MAIKIQLSQTKYNIDDSNTTLLIEVHVTYTSLIDGPNMRIVRPNTHVSQINFNIKRSNTRVSQFKYKILCEPKL